MGSNAHSLPEFGTGGGAKKRVHAEAKKRWRNFVRELVTQPKQRTPGTETSGHQGCSE